MRLPILVALLATLLLIAACKTKDKFEYTPEGYPFKYHINQSGEQPASGDEVLYKMYVRNGDSVVHKSHESVYNDDPFAKVRIPKNERVKKKPHVDALSIMSPGDSITLYYKIDTLPKKPAGFENAEFIYYDIVMVNFEKYEPPVKKTPKPLPVEDYEVTPNGYPVKFHVNKEGETPKAGDFINFRMYIRSDDGIVFSTEKNKTGDEKDPYKTAPFVLGNKPSPQMEAMSMMSAGDSLTLYYQIDTMDKKPQGFENSDMVYYDIAMVDVKSPARHNEQQREKNRAALESRKKVREQEPVVAAQMQKILKQYQAGELDVKIRNGQKGVRYMILEPGSGENIKDANYVEHHFYCIMKDGTLFGTSYPNGEPYQLLVGERKVVQGWEQGLKNLKQGSKAVLFVPSNMAYGAAGLEGKVPPNTELIFYVDIVEVR